jgi:hypothetical protein
MEPFEKVIRQLLHHLSARLREARFQNDKRREEIVCDIIDDLQKICNAVLMEDK